MRVKILAVVSIISVVYACSSGQDDEEYIAAVEENLFEGQVVGAIYQSPVSTIIQGNPVEGAVVGGMIAALLGFGPIGTIFGSAIGASSEAGYTEVMPEQEVKLVVVVESKDSTFHFEILYGCFGSLDANDRRKMFSKDTAPGLLQLYSSFSPGQRIRIPSSRPLSKFAKVHSQFIYVGKEEIPYLDQ